MLHSIDQRPHQSAANTNPVNKDNEMAKADDINRRFITENFLSIRVIQFAPITTDNRSMAAHH